MVFSFVFSFHLKGRESRTKIGKFFSQALILRAHKYSLFANLEPYAYKPLRYGILDSNKLEINVDFIHFQFGTMATRSDLKKKMSEWAFAPNQTLISLPMDVEKRNFVRRENPNVVFSETYPTPFQNKAQLVCTR